MAGQDAAPACRLAVGFFAVVTLVAENRSRGYVWADVEQDLEIATVAGLTASQVKGQRQTVKIKTSSGFCWKSRRASDRAHGRPAPFCAGCRDMGAHDSSNRPFE